MASELNVGTVVASTEAKVLVNGNAILRVEDSSAANQARLHLRSGTQDWYVRTSDGGTNLVFEDDGAERVSIDSAGLATFAAGVVTSEKGVLSGSVEIDNDDFATITPQRKGGFLMLSTDTGSGDGGYPQAGQSGMIYFDCGGSLQIVELPLTGVGGSLETTISDVTGTSGTDDKVTVAVQTDVIKIENRMAARTFNYTILS